MDAATVMTPPGPFSIVTDGESVLASGWIADPAALVPRIAPRLRGTRITVRPDLGDITASVTRYFEGDLVAIDGVPVRQASGSFLEYAWTVLRQVPAGAPVTYAELAAKCGLPGAARAAGSVCGRNGAALFVPCHRVVRTGGAPGGFRWGLPVKRWLLDHEAGADRLAL